MMGLPMDPHLYRLPVFVAAVATCLAVGNRAAAHGDWGHIHVAGWAMENSQGELRELFQDPEVFEAALYGAAYPDAGYLGPSDAYRAFAEHSHWEPFIQDFIEYIRENYPPPFETLQSRKLVAFMLGCGAHGLQDEIFDSLFLDQVSEHDDGGQDEADPATDGFLFADGHARFIPPVEAPIDDLLPLYEDLPEDITRAVIEDSLSDHEFLYINDSTGFEIVAYFGRLYPDRIPWTREHYMDPDIPGSLRSEVLPTLRYMEALWERVNGRWNEDDLVAFAYPQAPWRLRSHETDTVDGWSTMIFGQGVDKDTVTGAFLDAEEGTVDFGLVGTQWGAKFTRLVRFRPAEALTPGDRYTIRLLAGAQLIDGTTTTKGFDHEFQVECTDDDRSECPDLGDVPLPAIDGSNWGNDPDPIDGDPTAAGDSGGCAIDRGPPSFPVAPFALFALALALVRRTRLRM